MSQLKLHKVEVRLDRPDKIGHDPAPDGMHVWLDVPGGTFDFQEYEVQLDKRKKPRLVPVTSSAPARIDTSLGYWCLWAEKGKTLTVSNKFESVTGFGFPLPSKPTNDKQFVLPNTRQLSLRIFNLSGFDDDDTRIVKNLDKAKSFYEKLHVELLFGTFEPRPKQADGKAWPDQWGNVNKGIFDTGGQKDPPVHFPPLNDPPWTPGAKDKNRDKTIVVLWLRFIVGPVAGFASPPSRLTSAPPSFPPFTKANPPLAPDHAVAAVGVIDTKRSSLFLAHELGHCLLADGGFGRQTIEGITTNLDKKYKDNVLKMLKKLGLNEKPDDLYAQLADDVHEAQSGNLMFWDGDQLGQDLTPLQVALIRRAKELRWPKEV